MSIISPSKGNMPNEKGTSMPQSTHVGSGSRPTKSSVPIETSAPANPHTLGRDPGGSLK